MKTDEISARTRYVLNLLELKKSDKVLNVGISNIPEIEMNLEKKSRECVTIDIDDKKLENCRKYLKKAKLIKADITGKLPFRDNYFDKAIALEVLEHIEDDASALREIIRVLKPKANIIISVPNKNSLHLINPVRYTEHKRHYSNKEIAGLLENNGLDINDFNVVENWTLLANLYIHLFHKFILRKPRNFNIFRKSAEKTYLGKNSSGMDIIVKAVKK